MRIFTPNSKKKKEKESYIFVYITFNTTDGGLLVFFDDEVTTFRKTNYRFRYLGIWYQEIMFQGW